MKKFFNVFKEKWLRKASLTILLVILILIAFFGVNVLFKKIDLTPIDFTSQKIYSLSEESKTQIKKIEQNVDVFFLNSSSIVPVGPLRCFPIINSLILLLSFVLASLL